MSAVSRTLELTWVEHRERDEQLIQGGLEPVSFEEKSSVLSTPTVHLLLTSLQVEFLLKDTLLVTKPSYLSSPHPVLEQPHHVNNTAELTYTPSAENSLKSERSGFIFAKLHILVFFLKLDFHFLPTI